MHHNQHVKRAQNDKSQLQPKVFVVMALRLLSILVLQNSREKKAHKYMNQESANHQADLANNT